jgi:hypothetical protein
MADPAVGALTLSRDPATCRRMHPILRAASLGADGAAIKRRRHLRAISDV